MKPNNINKIEPHINIIHDINIIFDRPYISPKKPIIIWPIDTDKNNDVNKYAFSFSSNDEPYSLFNIILIEYNIPK